MRLSKFLTAVMRMTLPRWRYDFRQGFAILSHSDCNYGFTAEDNLRPNTFGRRQE
jgi:hypothetical protein